MSRDRRSRWLNFALKKASESEFEPYLHCAVLVKSNRLLGIGLNKRKDGSIYDPIYKDRMLHAEVDLLSKFEAKDVRGATLYIAGRSRCGNVVCSAPCRHCQHYLRRWPLKKIFYLDRGEVREYVPSYVA